MTGPRVDDRITRERTVREALRRFRLELQQEVKTNIASSGVGDVRGPSSSTNMAVARFDTTSGKLLANSPVTISDIGEVGGILSLETTGTMLVGGEFGVAGAVNLANLSGVGTRVVGVDEFGTLTTITISGSGDVVGPASATDNALARFNGITGKLIQNSTATLTDGGSLSVTHLNVHNGIGGVEAINVIGHVSVSGELQVWEGGEILGTLNSLTPSKNATYIRITNDGINQSYFGMGDETPGSSFATSVAHATFISSTTDIELIRAGTKRLGVTSAGVEVTGTLLVNGVAVSTGDVTGPASANNNSLVRFSGSTGKLIKAGGSILSDAGDLTLAGNLTAVNTTLSGTLNVVGLTTFTGGFKLANAAWLRWRNAADTLDYDVMRVTSGNAVVINAPPSSSIIQQLNGVDAATLDAAGLHLTGALSLAGAVTGVTTLAASGLLTALDAHIGGGEEAWNFRVSGAATSARFRIKNRVLANGVYLQSVNSDETLQSSMTFAASGFTFETGDVGIGLAPVGSNRVLAVGSTARPTTYIRVVSQTVGEAWFESLVSGALEMFVGLNNSGVTSRGITTGHAGITWGNGDLVFAPLFTERMRLTNAGSLRIAGLGGAGTRVVGVTSDGTLTITSLGSGDVVGPASATNNAIATFNGTTGKIIRNNSGVTIVSNVINASGYSVGGSAGDSGTIDTSTGTWEITVSGGIITNIQQLS